MLGVIHILSFRYGLKAIARARIRTALFFLLLTVVVVLLSLGIGMWSSAQTMLAAADETFLTAGEFVFTLGNYPDTAFYDPQLAAAKEAFDIGEYAADGALLAEEHLKQKAYIEGYEAQKADMPYGNYAVLKVNPGKWYDSFNAYVSEILSAPYIAETTASGRQLKAAYVNLPDGADYTLEENHVYLLFGYFYVAPMENGNRFQALSFEEVFGEDPAQDTYPPAADVTDGEETFWASEQGEYFAGVIERLKALNGSLDMIASSRVEAVEEFHRGAYTLTEGSYFTDEDYKAGLSCIISREIADQLGLSVGDKLTMSMYRNEEGFRPNTGFTDESVYTVRGIYQTDGTGTPVYIPDAGQARLKSDPDCYTLGRVVVDNRSAEEYEAAIAAKLPEGVRLDLYDQGYGAAAEPLLGMRETAALISAMCACACLLVLWFFAYLFVYRAGEQAKILLRLGSGAGRVRVFLLSGCGAIALAASAVGSVIGYFISKRVITSVYESIQANSVYDYRFSIKGYGVQSESFTAAPEADPRVYVLLAVAVFLLALILCAFFAGRVMRKQDARYRHKRAQKPRHRVSGKARYIPVPGLSLRYSLTSILRGGGRSLTVPALFMALVIFLCVFSGVRAGYGERLASVYDDIPVTMRFTDMTGRKIDGLYIEEPQLEEIEETEFAAEGWTVNNTRYMLMGVTRYADGTLPDEPPEPFEIPENEWTLGLFEGQLNLLTSPLVATNEVSRAPEFSYQSEPEITWAAGLDWDDFRYGSEEGTLTFEDMDGQSYILSAQYCLLPASVMEKYGLSLGDSILVSLFSHHDYIGLTSFAQEFTIAGVYISAGTQEILYGPANSFSKWYTSNVVLINGELVEYETVRMYDSAGFVLKDSGRLSEFKDWLSGHYDQAGGVRNYRKWVVVDDKALYDTLDQLTRHIGYMDLIYPVILLLAAGIGFIASTLLLRNRMDEIAVLRSLGSGRLRIFLSFFLESVMLSIPGTAAGLLISFAILRGWQTAFWQNAALLAVCYYLGAAAAILQACRRALLRSLAEREV